MKYPKAPAVREAPIFTMLGKQQARVTGTMMVVQCGGAVRARRAVYECFLSRVCLVDDFKKSEQAVSQCLSKDHKIFQFFSFFFFLFLVGSKELS